MKREKFIKTIITGAAGMATLSAFRNFTSTLKEQEQLMPVLFVGHGSPMNGIQLVPEFNGGAISPHLLYISHI